MVINKELKSLLDNVLDKLSHNNKKNSSKTFIILYSFAPTSFTQIKGPKIRVGLFIKFLKYLDEIKSLNKFYSYDFSLRRK
jgi:hypothetical protein